MSVPPTHAVVRSAVLADLAAIQALARRTIDASYRSFLGDDGVDWFINSGASDKHIEDHFRLGDVSCMEADGEIVGVVILDGPTLDLMMIDVRRHRQGWGRLLLARVEELMFADNDSIRLETFVGNAPAISFYEACGWLEAGRTESEAGVPTRIEYVKHRRNDLGQRSHPRAAPASEGRA